MNNGHGRLFDAVCTELDHLAVTVLDHRQRGYCHYRIANSHFITVYQACEPAPYAAADLEHLISAGAKQIIFINGSGSLREDKSIGSILLPDELVREEGTSFHYVPASITLRTYPGLNKFIKEIADRLNIPLLAGKHWTTDAIYRETRGKIERYRDSGVLSVDMEVSALAAVALYRQCDFSALLMFTDVCSSSHTGMV